MNIRKEWKGIIIDMRQKRLKKLAAVLGMLFCTAVLIFLYRLDSQRRSSQKKSTEDGKTTYSFAMGTSVSVSLYGTSDDMYGTVEQAIKDLDEQEISWRSEKSELYKLNHTYETGQASSISDTLYVALTQAYNVCRDSNGALDITIRPLANLWNIESATEEDFLVPSQKDIKKTLEKTGYEAVLIGENHTVTIEKTDMTLDLGAVGKGFALDVVEDLLKKNNVRGATVSVGGSILVYGEKDDKSSFRVGIRDPEKSAEDMIGYLEFEPGSHTCISTSGDYEKYIEKDGKRYHHILDRSTGAPAESGLASVTVVCENGLYSDALSTACYVLGYEKSLPLLKKYNADAVFIDKNQTVTVTDGLRAQFHEVQK